MTPCHRSNRIALAAALLLGLSLSLAPGLVAQDTRPAGAWRLDRASSDSVPSRFRPPPRDSLRRDPEPGEGPDGEGPGGQRPGEVGGGGGYGGGYGRRGSHGYSDKELAGMRRTIQLARQAPELLAILPRDSLRIVYGAGDTVRLRIGGANHKYTPEGGGEIETGAHWKSTALVVERKVKGGGKVKETYRLGLGGRRLLDFVEIGGLAEPLDFRRQYLPEGAEAPDST